MKPKNQLLNMLSPEVFDRLAPHLVQVSLAQGEIVHAPNEPLIHLYFPLDCLFSVVITMQNGATAEVGMVGSREVLGINAVMGDNETTQTTYVVQVAGSALKIHAAILREELNRGGELHDLLLRYMQAFLAQVSQTAACNALHVLEQRLARWLLET
jgi:CRP-like cAMP-binding protein